MTRNQLFRLLIAMHFAAAGSASLFIWICPRGIKKRSTQSINIDKWFGSDVWNKLMDDLTELVFRPDPILKTLLDRCGCKFSGGDYIQRPFDVFDNHEPFDGFD